MTAERERYVEANLGLAHSCVRRYTGRGIEYDDLYQTACIGLVKAAENFDDTRGYKFSTYAVPVILGELKQLFRSDGSIKVSRRIKELGIKAQRLCDEYYAEHGDLPRVSEIAEMLGVTSHDAAEAMCAARPPDSLDNGETQAQYSASERFDDISTENLALKQVIGKLEPVDRAIIIERYIHDRTQNATAQLLGMTQVQISRKERRILKFIRAEMDR